MSFLEVQDLATVAARSDFSTILSALCCDSDALLGALEASFGACLIALVIRRRAKH
jgi:hypothetical protein